MDWSTVSSSQWTVVAVLWLGMMVGKAMSMESRVLMAFVVVALLAPNNFGVVALAVLIAAMTVKTVMQFASWT